jgi:hypothetical protein
VLKVVDIHIQRKFVSEFDRLNHMETVANILMITRANKSKNKSNERKPTGKKNI